MCFDNQVYVMNDKYIWKIRTFTRTGFLIVNDTAMKVDDMFKKYGKSLNSRHLIQSVLVQKKSK